ncbi:hypothetical protein DY000_02024534 [Brassica cretica]|uniref:Uncharacterized protein n=1 Tax=Brassica cretica TaxID=69181 RepID=A0ABQ7EJ46_BRACR|nr:hypothetical protein DY000_02024534 [Brassica cretica]
MNNSDDSLPRGSLRTKRDRWRKKQRCHRTAPACALQENIGILTDIPTENEILRISRGISEEILRKPKFWVSSEFPRNSEETLIRRYIPRKFRGEMCSSQNSEEIPTNK